MDVRTQLRVLDQQTARDRRSLSFDPAQVMLSVAENMEDLMKVIAVRAAVYMSEQNCPYAEEFDGNDFTATHILCRVGEEPAATMRIRYFADFAKPERIAVRSEYRKCGLAAKMITYGMELCRQKGYVRLYGHAQSRLVPFWERLGWHVIGTPEFVFSDHRYVEMACILEPHPDPMVVGKDPLELNRLEGVWDEPGVLDRSTVRPATCPHGDE